MNIFTVLDMAAECVPDRIAVSCEHRQLSYSELHSAALTAAQQFIDSECDSVSVLDVNSLAVPIALFGAAAAGIPYVPLNYRLADKELTALIERIQPTYLITERERDDFIQRALAGLRDHNSESSADTIEAPMDPEAVAIQFFTSGTTGEPKAALLRHQNLMSYILGTVEFASADEADASLVAVPPYHIAGISSILSSVYSCRRQVQLADFDPQQWLSMVRDERVTNVFIVPTMLARIVEQIDSSDILPALPDLKAIAYGGGKMPKPLIHRALTLFPTVNFTNAYGLTETSSTITLLTPEDHRRAIASDDLEDQQRLGSVGKPLPGLELEIRDSEGGTLSADAIGEVWVRGEQVSGEYRERSAKHSDGWFPTRDTGYIDQQGYLFLAGRADDIIVRGGENISPGEVEDVILSHASVSDACVVGVPDDDWGEAIAAVVVLKNNVDVAAVTEALTNSVREQLRSSRVPEQFYFQSDLPYSETGKLLRRLVREAVLRS